MNLRKKTEPYMEKENKLMDQTQWEFKINFLRIKWLYWKYEEEART